MKTVKNKKIKDLREDEIQEFTENIECEKHGCSRYELRYTQAHGIIKSEKYPIYHPDTGEYLKDVLAIQKPTIQCFETFDDIYDDGTPRLRWIPCEEPRPITIPKEPKVPERPGITITECIDGEYIVEYNQSLDGQFDDRHTIVCPDCGEHIKEVLSLWQPAYWARIYPEGVEPEIIGSPLDGIFPELVGARA